MATITIHKAKTNLSKLIERALAGEEIVIARGKQPVVKLVPVAAVSPHDQGQAGLAVSSAPFASKEQYEQAKAMGYGSMPNLWDDRFDEPLDDAELEAWQQ